MAPLLPKLVTDTSSSSPTSCLMAQKVAEKLPSIYIPAMIETTLGRAIAERRRVSDWFRSCHGQNTKNASDLRHVHFIGVLEGAFAILCPFTEMKKRSGTIRKPKALGVEPLALRNAFAGLGVEEPSESLDHEEPLTGADKETEKIPKVAPVMIEKDETELEAEFYFANRVFPRRDASDKVNAQRYLGCLQAYGV